jgi:SAM-dependent methyltransferase
MDVIQRTRTPAEIYDQYFVPALFQQWGNTVAEMARVGPGDSVLDVACGTGAFACAALERVGSRGSVTGLDVNPDMLSVARRKSARIDWREGRAESLPFLDASFDAVGSQFGMMFFEDRPAALREMMRVLKPGRRMAVAVCGAVEDSPGYALLADLLQRLFGQRVADAFRAPFILGDEAQLRSICAEAGLAKAQVEPREQLVRFDSIDAMISTERACIWTLGGMLDDAQFARLIEVARREFKPFVGPTGEFVFAMPALVITAEKS